MVSNKHLSAFFFASLGQGRFRCNICGSERKPVAGSGYFNLMAHLAGKHIDYEDQYASYQSNSSRPLQDFGFVAEEASHIFQWIRWITERSMPIHEVEDVLTRAMSKLRPVTVKAVKKCMEGIAIEVVQPLKKELGVFFGLMFDGWSHARVHYVALVAVYVWDSELRVLLLGLSTRATHLQSRGHTREKKNDRYGRVYYFVIWVGYREVMGQPEVDLPQQLINEFGREELGVVWPVDLLIGVPTGTRGQGRRGRR